MARFRKKSRRRSYSAAGRRRTRRKGGMGGMLGSVTKPMIGAGVVVAYERFLSPYIPVNGLAKNAVELGIGAMLSNKGGFIGAGAQSLLAINAYKIVAGLTGGMAAGAGSNAVVYG